MPSRVTLRALPEPELGGRAFPRYRVNAHAIWTVDGIEVRWPIWTLSWGGASLVVGALQVPTGLRRAVELVQLRRALGSADVEIVHTKGSQMGLRFLKIDQKLRESLEALFAELTPMR